MASFAYEADGAATGESGDHVSYVVGNEADASNAGDVADGNAVHSGSRHVLDRDCAIERLAAKVHDESWILHHSCIGHGIEAGNRTDEDATAGYGAADFRLEA